MVTRRNRPNVAPQYGSTIGFIEDMQLIPDFPKLRHSMKNSKCETAVAIKPLSLLYFRCFIEQFRRTMRHSPYRWFCAVLIAGAVLLEPGISRAELAKSGLLESNICYLRVDQMEPALPTEIGSAIGSLAATNRIEGIVLDLRFAGGSDSDTLKPTLEALEHAKLPMAILVNAETTGAAATLARDLREANAGLVFGSAVANLQPDIAVSAGTNNEKDLLINPYGVMAQADTNSAAGTNLLSFVDVDHTTEADLVRAKIKDGEQDDTTAHTPTPAKPFIRDPVLAHGVDFIEGVAALHLSKG